MQIFDEKLDFEHERKIAVDTLERYSGSKVEEFQPLLLLTNFPRYVEYFAKKGGVEIKEGAMFKVAHCPKEQVSIIDFKIGSPAAALVVDVCSYLPFKASLLLGMCGGLRHHYKVGDYFVPVAAIRGDGTSDFYFPPEVPAMANFLVQKAVTEVLDEGEAEYQVGITHTTNKRFWEFNREFRERLKENRSQAIEMECATLFISSYKSKLPLGALLLISDKPLDKHGIKTKESSEKVYETHTADHVDKGIAILKRVDFLLQKKVKGAERGEMGGEKL